MNIKNKIFWIYILNCYWLYQKVKFLVVFFFHDRYRFIALFFTAFIGIILWRQFRSPDWIKSVFSSWNKVISNLGLSMNVTKPKVKGEKIWNITRPFDHWWWLLNDSGFGQSVWYTVYNLVFMK